MCTTLTADSRAATMECDVQDEIVIAHFLPCAVSAASSDRGGSGSSLTADLAVCGVTTCLMMLSTLTLRSKWSSILQRVSPVTPWMFFLWVMIKSYTKLLMYYRHVATYSNNFKGVLIMFTNKITFKIVIINIQCIKL